MTTLSEAIRSVAPGEVEHVLLSSVARIVSGGTPKTGEASFWNGDIPWATPKDLSGLASVEIHSTPRLITEAGLRNSSAEILPVNSVLFSSRAPIGLLAINTTPMATNQGFKSFVPDPEKLDSRYLYRWLEANRAKLQNMGVGATFKEVSKAIVSRLVIPLPSLDEQRRVAALLDKADKLRAKRRHALAHLDTLTQSVFHNMFRDAENLSSLGEYVDFRYGTSNKASATGIATLRIPNIVSGSIDLTDLKVISVPKEEEERLVLRNGDLLFVRSNGNPANVGRCAVFDTDRIQLGNANPRDFIYASYLIRARMRKPGLSSIFLQTYLSSAAGRAQLLAGAKTSAGQYNINTQALGNLKVPIVSLERQARFEKSVSGIELLRDRYTAQLAELDALFSVLQHRAFRGEL